MGGSRQPGWIRPLNNVGNPASRVVCLPHSGGSAGSYSAWVSAMPPDVQLLAVQYPGRGDRLSQPPVGSIAEMSAAVAAELLRFEPVPYALFGHSLGALVAYETALTMRDSGFPPGHLFVSGSAAPGQERSGLTHLAGDEELWTSVCELGGIDPAIAENAEMRKLLLPALRSDVRASETYRPASSAEPLPCPLRCYYSPEDPLTQNADMTAWAARTTARFTTRRRPGGHFHLWLDTDELVGDILGVMPRRETLTA
ncbi:thioesterase II family protein [Streptomyces sp. CA-250714]|uniref:thioesterase II family protein n=1 Tax=Streptomyces sp. CA-250714 TaxID=3240060 RepID=UPI003D92FB2B